MVEDAGALLRATRRLNETGRFVWIASDGWGKEELPVLGGNEVAAEGALTIELQSARLPEFDGYFRRLRPATNDRNPWFREVPVVPRDDRVVPRGEEPVVPRDDRNPWFREVPVVPQGEEPVVPRMPVVPRDDRNPWFREVPVVPRDDRNPWFRECPWFRETTAWFREYWERAHDCSFELDRNSADQRHNATSLTYKART